MRTGIGLSSFLRKMTSRPEEVASPPDPLALRERKMWPRMYDDNEGQPLTPDHCICTSPPAGSKSALIQVALLGKQGTHTVRWTSIFFFTIPADYGGKGGTAKRETDEETLVHKGKLR
ncbi:hypothetical protein PoB_000112400 [Plakobranchus ocellatus]|uniref:Uncharacterized protein n=1 Tax=Plakobranchus ocellatus TaxID=259542 RepID=A0AAV3XXX1_9GAST|nr:hypothetical protein PoB_000112400 [Plakobranchus ocellatus]